MHKPYYSTIHSITTTGHWITDNVGKALKAYGISEPQYNVLRILEHANGEPVSVGSILEQMVQRNSNITRLVDKLMVKGFVHRQECPVNRRKMDISITEAGSSLLKDLDKSVQQFHQPMIDNLSEKELKTLKFLIKKLTNRTDD